jgi:hypothetical protein
MVVACLPACVPDIQELHAYGMVVWRCVFVGLFGFGFFLVVGLVGVGAFGEPSVGCFSDRRRSSFGNKARRSVVATRGVVVCVDGLQRMTLLPSLHPCCCGLFGSFLLLLQWNSSEGRAGRPGLGTWTMR